jgi:nickel-dependent lactate racemase
MRFDIPYNGVCVEMQFPDGTVVLEPKILPIVSEDSIKRKILSNFRKVENSFRGKRITVVVNDATRRLPTSKILNFLIEIVPADGIEILIATGTHRPPTDDEIDLILGETRSLFGDRIFTHDCRDKNSLVSIGCTRRGTPVVVNKKLLEAEAVICVNSVEPHFFAGFTGGRKSLIPGLAGFETTVANHSFAKQEEARSLSLEKNPVHLDLEEATSLLAAKEMFSIQLVVSRSGDVIDLFGGELKTSFQLACAAAHKYYSIPISRKYDIVFAIGEPPLDINLYQLQKGQEHGAEAVRDGGILVVVGACAEGIGSEHFVKLADDYPSPAQALSDKALSDNKFGIHKLVKTARRLQRIKIWYVTNLDDNIVSKVYYEPKRSPRAALEEALGVMGRDAKVAVLKDACFFVPMMIDSKGEK